MAESDPREDQLHRIWPDAKEAIAALEGVCFCGSDIVKFRNDWLGWHPGISHSGAVTILDRLRFMGFEIKKTDEAKQRVVLATGTTIIHADGGRIK
jgi:hypothetical protein